MYNGRNYLKQIAAQRLGGWVLASGLSLSGLSAMAQTSGLVAAYSFNEGSGTTVADGSGKGNSGTISGATWTTSGKYGSGLTFNGTSARVSINNSASLQLTTGMTLEAWVNPSTVSSAWRDVIYKGNDNYYLEATSTTSSRPAMGGTFSSSLLVGTAALTANAWAHLAATYDGTTMRLYVNGTQVASRAQTGAIATSTNPLQIGSDSLYGQYFKGIIDEVRVYNVALTAAQIQADMNTPIGPDTQAPAAPATLTATAVSGSQINLSWAASTDNVGVTGYLIERQGGGVTSFTQIGTSTTTTFNDTGLTAGTAYSYQVRATDAAGNKSGYSPVASATTQSPDTQAPTAPATLTATAVSGSQINLSWAASSDNVGVTGYLIERQGGGVTSFTQIGTSTTTTFNDTGLAAGTTYSYQVRATDAAGNKSGYSPIASATTTGSANGLVAAYGFSEGSGTTTLDASGNGNVATISGATWAASGKYGSALVFNGTSALVTINNSASLQLTTGMTLEAWVNPSVVNTAWRDVIYKANDNYYLEGTSSSGGAPAGGGTFSPTPIFGTAALAANTWTHLALTYDGATLKLYVNGTQVASKAQTGAIATSTNPLQIGGDSLYGQFFQGMIDEVRIYKVALTAAQVQADMNTPIAPDTQAPTAPASLTATAVGGSQINLSWSASTDNVGVTGYLIERLGGGVTTFTQIATTTSTTFNDTGLSAGTAYSYQVRATDAAGNKSGYSPMASATTQSPDTQPPTAPATLSPTVVSGSEITLSWAASTDNVGVTGYLVERQDPGSSSFVQIGTVPGTAYDDTGLIASSSYSYRVRATDAAGNLGGYSPVATAMTGSGDTTPPTAPASITATVVSTSEIDLSWAPATDNVGVTGYRLERCDGAGCTVFVKLAYPTGTTYADTGLAPNTSYSYIVRATDAAGNLGPYSPVATAVTPGTPTSLVAAYAFNEGTGTTVSDSSGNSNNGTVSGATWTASGKYGSALVFNGTSALVTINNSASLQLTTGMTLEAWVNPSVVNSAWRDVIYKGNDNYYLEGTSASGGAPAAGGTFGTVDATFYGTGALAVNTWTHLALTFDGTTARLYVNGVLASSQTEPANLITSANPLQIGGDSLYGQFFQGMIDEVRVYNVALTLAQIQTDMATPIAGGSGPTAPANLTATLASGTQVNLTWSPSTASGGIAAYLIERCQGVGCNSFVQVGSSPTTGYSDTGLTANTTYNYRVRALDNSGNLGPYSLTAQAYTGIAVSPRVAALTATGTQQFTATVGSVTWSVDGVNGGSASVGTISTTGLYTPPATVGSHVVTATTSDQSQSASATVYISGFAGKLTHHNDTLRTGENLNETVLTPANVNAGNFGRLFSYPIDGVSHASPLYVASVNIPGKGFHNVVYVATEHNSVFAFDADGLIGTPLWQTSFINPAQGITTVPANDTGECCDIAPEIGITSTPVIDPSSGTLYAVAKTKEVSGGNTTYVQRLHALDITTGAEKLGGPVVIAASVPGTGNGSSGGRIAFDALRENQRPGLLLDNGFVYMAFSSHGDNNPWHGWVLGYNASTLAQSMAHNVTPNGYGGGIWQSGGGLGGDSDGNVYYVSGNGPFDANTGGPDYGDSFVKVAPNGAVADYFTPFTEATLNSQNEDLGSGGLLLLPDQPGSVPHIILTCGKDGTIYLVNRDNMGHYNANNNSQIVQSLVNIFPHGTPEPGNYSAPVYYNGQVYFSPIADTVQAFRLSNGLLTTSPASRSSQTYIYPGGAMAASGNGNQNGILWAIQYNGVVAPAVLYAYDASNLATELYDSNQLVGRDAMDFAAKYTAPLVANGKVFVASISQLAAYGLLP
jgi:chitodextrinase